MAYRRNTEYSETMQIPQASRGFFIRNRDTINDTHHVRLFFPRDQRSGDYQTMIIQGGPIAITKSRVRLNQILVEANQEFQDYRERQARRNKWQRNMDGQTAPSQPSPKQMKKNPVIKNPFALLDVDDDSTMTVVEKPKEEFPELVRDEDELARKERRQTERRERIAHRKATQNTETPMSFAAAAAKPVEEFVEPACVSEKPVENPVSMTMLVPKEPVSWADMVDSDSEDEDRQRHLQDW
jgi:hypothetical protein